MRGTDPFEIRVAHLEPGRYRVEVDGERARTVHEVAVHRALVEGLGLTGVDEAAIVHETFVFLLEREPSTAILEEFSLETVATYFPEYFDELRTRFGA